MSHESVESIGQTATTCYRHPDRVTGVRCQRCERPMCPKCMRQASVGWHCVDCASRGKQKVYTSANLPGTRGLVSNALIAINVLAFVAQIVFLGARSNSAGTSAWEFGTNGYFVDQLGEWWRIVTGGFLHFGIFHLGMNMFALHFLGPRLERALGPTRFGLAYFASLLGGSFGAMLLQPNSLVMGASGAIFGLLGLLVMRYRSAGVSINDSGLGPVLLLNLIITFSGYVSMGGHVGGFVVGAALGAVLFGTSPQSGPMFGRDATKADLFLGAAIGAMFLLCLWAATNPLNLGP